MKFSALEHGSLWVLTPLDELAEAWMADRVSGDAIPWTFGIIIEGQFVESIINGIVVDGGKVEFL